MTVGVGSPDVSQNSRQSEVTTLAGSSDSESLSLRGDCGRRKSRPKPRVLASVVLLAGCLRSSELPTYVGSSDCQNYRSMPGVPASAVLAGCLTAHVESPDVRRKFRPSKVPTFAGSSDIDLHARTFLTLCEQCVLLTSEVPKSASKLPT